MKKDVVYLVWTNKQTNNKYKIAKLYKQNNKYYFNYIVENVILAKKEGFNLLISFPMINATYESPYLFAVFSARLPEETRPEIKTILETYKMSKYDEFELLKRSGAKLPTDNYEFVK